MFLKAHDADNLTEQVTRENIHKPLLPYFIYIFPTHETYFELGFLAFHLFFGFLFEERVETP